MSDDSSDSASASVASRKRSTLKGTGKDLGTQRERIPVLVFEDPDKMARQVARKIANLIEERQAVGESAVLGLPTGSTPLGVYEELVRLHEEEGLDFSNVVTFNLDEYYPISPDSLQSYHRYMEENLFNHVNIPDENIHIPDGSVPDEQVEQHCLEYEHAIQKAGGIDLMLLGIGRSGHIGFNESGSDPESRTRLIVLDELTRKDAASDFFGEENVPREAITMGIKTILDADEIVLMATGEHKAPIIKRAVEEPPNRQIAATYLQEHGNAEVFVDRAAASHLTREQTPWLVREVDWDQESAKRAVIWLSQKLDKAILRLEAADFHSNQLHALVHRFGDVDHLCRMIYEDLRNRITYPDDLFSDQRALVFSPHPDDDVISMGGMLSKLVSNGNEVDVAYMTNGSVAVFDQDVERHLQFLDMTVDTLYPDDSEVSGRVRDRVDDIRSQIRSKDAGEVGSEVVQKMKALIRYTEAIAAIEVMGLGVENARFLDMPFYRTGRVKKDPIGEEDVQIILDLLRDFEPDHVFVAGDLSDPHGTHRMCYSAIKEALERYRRGEGTENGQAKDGSATDGRSAERPFAVENPPTVWLYRGAWQEWEIDEADVFLPLSKADLDEKIDSIFKHESQKDRALFPGAYDEREFWQRARDRNTQTASELDAMGLPEFYATEAYVVVEEMP